MSWDAEVIDHSKAQNTVSPDPGIAMQVGRAIFAVRDLKPNETQDLWLPVKPLLKQDKVRPFFRLTLNLKTLTLTLNFKPYQLQTRSAGPRSSKE